MDAASLVVPRGRGGGSSPQPVAAARGAWVRGPRLSPVALARGRGSWRGRGPWPRLVAVVGARGRGHCQMRDSLNYIKLYRIILYYILFYFIVLYYIILYYTILYYIILYYIIGSKRIQAPLTTYTTG